MPKKQRDTSKKTNSNRRKVDDQDEAIEAKEEPFLQLDGDLDQSESGESLDGFIEEF